MGLFDRFRNLKKDSEYEEEVDPRQQQFDAICNDIEVIKSGLNFHPPITIINSKKIIKLMSKPTGI